MTLIQFNTAKLAYEKGLTCGPSMFCWEVKYSDCGNFISIPELNINNVSDSDWINDIRFPTQSELQKHLREERNLHVGPYRLNNAWCCDVYDISRGCYITKNAFNKKTFEVYEDSLENSLQDALKLIENEIN